MRNEYLKKNIIKINFDYLDIITDNLVDRAILIMKYRKDFIDIINKYIDKSFYKIMKKEGLSLVYEPNLINNDKTSILNFYKSNVELELNKKMTLFGPHRDDFSFMLDGFDLKLYGSQGQQRVAILSLKLSEISLFKEVTGSYPIVLLDDVFSELDIEKRQNLLKFIKSNIQFIITTTDLNNISNKILDKSSVFKIKEGNILSR
jgi:DNA replication and repair protein RecF